MTCGPGRDRGRGLPLSILAVLGALVALAGCGGSSNPLHAVRTAATNTLSLTTQSTLTSTGAQLFGGSAGTILGRAQYSFPKGLGYEALQVPAHNRAAGTAYVVFMPQQLWSKPVLSSALPKGHLWITATYSDSSPASRRPGRSHSRWRAPIRSSSSRRSRRERLQPRPRGTESSTTCRSTSTPSRSIWRGRSRRRRPGPFAPRCSRSSPRSARVEAPTRARGCRSRGSTEQGASPRCGQRFRARGSASCGSRCGRSAARSR